MIIHIPEGISFLVYPAEQAINLPDYKTNLNYVYLLETPDGFKFYDPNAEIVSDITTLEPSLCYKIDAKNAFDIIV